MISTFHGIEVGKNSLLTHQHALNVTGHNISNMNRPEYSRQKVTMSSQHPMFVPGLGRVDTAGQLGQGVIAQEVARVYDHFIDDRIVYENGYQGYWNARQFYLRKMEYVHNEPNSPNLKTLVDRFTQSWNALAINPTESAARESLRNVGISLSRSINEYYNHFTTLRHITNGSIIEKVDQINLLAKQISELNLQIRRIQNQGDNPNDLMDTRDQHVRDLGKLVNISVERNQNEFLVHIGGEILVQGEVVQKLRVENDSFNEGLAKVVWEKNGDPLVIENGELRGLFEIRDYDIVNQIESLDALAINLVHSINSIHREGFGLNFNTGNNFFIERPISANLNGNNSAVNTLAQDRANRLLRNGNYDRNGDAILDSTALFAIAGTEQLRKDQTIGISGQINLGTNPLTNEIITVNYAESDTVANVIDKINRSGAEIVAYLDSENRLVLKATRSNLGTGKLGINGNTPVEIMGAPIDELANYGDFIIRHLEDSGRFLSHFSGVLNYDMNTQAVYDWRTPDQMQNLRSNEWLTTVTPQEHAASWIALDPKILADSNNIAAARGMDTNGDGIKDRISGEGDGNLALQIVASLDSEAEVTGLNNQFGLDHEAVRIDQFSESFKPFLDRVIADLGTITQTAILEVEAIEQQLLALENLRQEVSGVNIDEEMASILTYQHGYQAAARFVTVIDRMLDTIINHMAA